MTVKQNMNLQLKLDKARWWALSNAPFYSQLAMGLADSIQPGIKTAQTDGRVIKWGPEFLAGLTDQETRFVLLHEALHCAHGHLWRMDYSDPQAQLACDHAINLTLLEAAKVSGWDITMPKGGAADIKFKGKAEEEILAALKTAKTPKQKPGDKPGQGQGDTPDPGQCGGFAKPSPESSTTKSNKSGPSTSQSTPTLAEEWEGRVAEAVMAAKAAGRGNAPGDLARVLERIQAVKPDWRDVTADFVRSATAHRNDWSRSSRRMAGQPVVYPKKRAGDVGKIIFVRDTSGSINQDTLAQFNALIESCLADVAKSGIVMDVDARINAEYEIEPGESCPATAKGGGGTDFRPAFHRAAQLIENGEQIAGLVYLTDLDGQMPDKAPDYPVLWISTTTTIAPWGRTIKI